MPLLLSCGKQGDPLPPLRRAPQPVSGLSVAQRGETIEVRFTAPRVYGDGERLPVVEIELLRADREGALEQVAQRTLRRAAPGEVLLESEPLPAPGTLLRFAARARVGKKEVSALAAAAPLVVQVPPSPPAGVTATPGAHGVDLAWQVPVLAPAPPRPAEPAPMPSPTVTPAPSPGPTAAASPSPAPSPPATPAPGPVTPSFRVYRRGREGAYAAPLIAAPTLSPAFEDSTAAEGQHFCYVVRTVVSLDPPIESAPSNEVCVDVVDVTPPGTPEGGAAFAQDDGSVELSWSPLLETGLGGYRVYRKVGQGARERVAELPPAQTRWRDTLPGGARRVYTLTAFDLAGNESAPSPAVVVERGP